MVIIKYMGLTGKEKMYSIAAVDYPEPEKC